MSAKIDEKYFELFESVGHRKHYTSDEHIIREGQKAEDIYLIVSGRAIVYLITENGKQLTIDVLRKGTLFGDSSFMRNGIYNYNIMAVTDLEIIICNTKKLIPVLRNHENALIALLEHMIDENHDLAKQVVRLAYYTSEQKIASYILDMSQNSRSIPFTHSDISNGTGLNRVTVSRTMKKFKDQHLIDYTYGIIYIEDRGGLKALVSEKKL